ncbi:MAG: hypothetical protein MR878_04330 [Campylobacter sp.]|uniref:hypothetical protein n=1 Tax=Campylobacter sp. TaxID=205 RepID=UPI002AA865DA|nr:hypothetical protein [Campylobacter sp.]MCI7014596.1 hypothetical protein [Campylobacter sp.]
MIRRPYEYYFQINIMNFISCIGFFDNYHIYRTYSEPTLGKIYQHGYCLFLGSDGKLCHVEFGKYDVETLKDYESLLSNITASNIKIITNQSDVNKINQELKKTTQYYPTIPIMYQSQQIPITPQSQQMTTTQQQYTIQLPNPEAICIMDLPILRKDKIFLPYCSSFFVPYDFKQYSINSFIPTGFLRMNYANFVPYVSIVFEQYISYLANDRPEYINLIKCYLYFAIMPVHLHIQELSKYQLILVIIGGNKSGKELFFNNIIKPIFGEKYCLEVNDELLSKKNYLEEFDNKIFYSFNNISAKSLANKEKKRLVENILSGRHISIGSKIIETWDKFKLVMLESEYVPYRLPENCFVLRAPNDIEKTNNEAFKSIDLLEQEIERDLYSLMHYIVNYCAIDGLSLPENEISLISNMSSEEVVKVFYNCLKTNDIPTLLKDNIEFKRNGKKAINNKDKEIQKMERLYRDSKRVARQWIRDLFEAKYPEFKNTISTSNLYKELTEKFGFENCEGNGGDKCFKLP